MINKKDSQSIDNMLNSNGKDQILGNLISYVSEKETNIQDATLKSILTDIKNNLNNALLGMDELRSICNV